MFLRPNSLKLDNYSILSELQHPSDHAPLIVNIQILKEFVPDVRYTIIQNNKEEIKFTLDIIKSFKKINTLYLTSKELLEITVQEFARTQEQLWNKHLKQVKITRQSKDR